MKVSTHFISSFNPLFKFSLWILFMFISFLNSSTLLGYSTAKNTQNNPCSIPESWFSGSVPKPSPENFTSSSNCEFHQISWQYFLWLTEKMENGKLRFQNLYSENAIDPTSPEAKNKDLHLIYQASSLGILVDQNGRALYTQMFINKTYRDFVLDNKLYDTNTLIGFDSETNFPVGSLSLKASWKILAPDEATKNIYTTTSDVRLLDLVDGKIVTAEDGKVEKNVPIALVGLHIAIVVEGHPEGIWATFEHRNNAPNIYAGQSTSDPISEKNYTLYKGKTLFSDVNQNNAPIITLDVESQKLKPVTQVARHYQYGGGKNSNQNNIEAINQSVMVNLKNSVWKNYMEVGAVWLLDTNALSPNWTPNNSKKRKITGSITLSNSAIETFTQDDKSRDNCFSCHNSMPLTQTPPNSPILPGKNINTSHLLLQRFIGGEPVNR